MEEAHHPYRGLPEHQFWRYGVQDTDPASLDPVISSAFKIGRSDPVAAAGSCFAQHIARHLR